MDLPWPTALTSCSEPSRCPLFAVFLVLQFMDETVESKVRQMVDQAMRLPRLQSMAASGVMYLRVATIYSGVNALPWIIDFMVAHSPLRLEIEWVLQGGPGDRQFEVKFELKFARCFQLALEIEFHLGIWMNCLIRLELIKYVIYRLPPLPPTHPALDESMVGWRGGRFP